jgi:hypothetical protein
MSYKGVIMIVHPVYAIRIDILNVFIFQIFIKLTEASHAILNHTKHKHVLGASLALSTNGKNMRVPGFRPLKCITVDGRKEEMVKKPDMRIRVVIELMVELKKVEK